MCNKERKEAGESLALDRMYLTGNNESVQSTPGAPAVNIVLLSYIFLPERNLKDRKYQEKKKKTLPRLFGLSIQITYHSQHPGKWATKFNMIHQTPAH